MYTRTYYIKNNIEFATYLKWNMVKHTVIGDILVFFLEDDSDNKFFKLVQDFTTFTFSKN